MMKIQYWYVKFFLTFILILLLIRLAMPYAILRYIEYRFDKIPEYTLHIDDIDLHLHRGAYVIKGVILHNVKKQIPVPLFSAESVELSLQWRVLIRGRLLAEMKIERPELNFVMDPKGKQQQLIIDHEWQNAIKALFPFNFNNIKVNNGKLVLQSFISHPPFKLFLKEVNGTLSNLQNAECLKANLVSTLSITARGMDGAPVTLDMDFEPFAKQPTFELYAEIKRLNIPEINDFLRHYTPIKVTKGTFDLYIEAATAGGKITGYAQPIVGHLDVEESNDDLSIEALYKNNLQLLSNLLENAEEKSAATEIVINGNINDPNASIWSIVSNLLGRIFIQTLISKVDQAIDIEDIEI